MNEASLLAVAFAVLIGGAIASVYVWGWLQRRREPLARLARAGFPASLLGVRGERALGLDTPNRRVAFAWRGGVAEFSPTEVTSVEIIEITPSAVKKRRYNPLAAAHQFGAAAKVFRRRPKGPPMCLRLKTEHPEHRIIDIPLFPNKGQSAADVVAHEQARQTAQAWLSRIEQFRGA